VLKLYNVLYKYLRALFWIVLLYIASLSAVLVVGIPRILGRFDNEELGGFFHRLPRILCAVLYKVLYGVSCIVQGYGPVVCVTIYMVLVFFNFMVWFIYFSILATLAVFGGYIHTNLVSSMRIINCIFLYSNSLLLVFCGLCVSYWFLFMCGIELHYDYFLFINGCFGSIFPTSFGSIPLIADRSSIFFIVVLVFVALGSICYSISYIKYSRFGFRFVVLMLLFAVSMCGLVLSNSMLLFFMFWECVGVCSFLLIGFWSDRVEAEMSAFKAVAANRIPDLALLVSFILIFTNFNVYDFTSAAVVLSSNDGVLVLVCGVLIVLAASGKSAQVGFTGWLVAAMEGPTPVSA